MSPVQEDGDDDDDCVRPFLSGSASSFSIMTGRKPGDSGKKLAFYLFSSLCVTSGRSPAQTQKVEVYLNYTSSPGVFPFFFVRLGLFVSGSH